MRKYIHLDGKIDPNFDSKYEFCGWVLGVHSFTIFLIK